MKRFLQKLIIFFLPIIILPLPLDYLISRYLMVSNTYPGEFEVMNDIYEGKASCDIAIYGSSRAWVHLNPKIMEDSLGLSVYNFGCDGHNFKLQYLRHLEFMKHNKKPKKIIVSVDVFSLQQRPDLYEPDQFLPYMLWNDNIYRFTSSYVGYKNADYFIPLCRYAGKSKALNMALVNATLAESQKKIKFRYKGFAGMNKSWNGDLDKALVNKGSYMVHNDTVCVNLFKTFIKECKQIGIDVILVYTPEYIDGQRFVANRKETIDLFKNIASNYNLPFLDYSEDKICLRKDLFYNASHLNNNGANLFTSKLSSRLKELDTFKVN